jgi:hypothetical protein
VIVAAVFGTAGLLKAAQPATFAGELVDYRILPGPLVRPAAILIPVLELAGAALVVIPATHAAGAITLLALLVVFTAAVTRNLIAGNTAISCACFGAKSRRLDASIPVRNGLLAAVLTASLASPSVAMTLPGVVAAVLAVVTAWVAIESIKLAALIRERSD